MPSAGHWSAAARSASWTRVLGGVERAEAPDQRTEDLRRELAQQALDIGVAHDGAVTGHIS